MSNKIISPLAIIALKEALSNIYWFRNDLKSYFYHSLNETEILSGINWNDYKRNIVSNIIDYLAKEN